MTTNKKLGLLLVPLVPLAALGIVELARQISVPAPTAAIPAARSSEAPTPAPSARTSAAPSHVVPSSAPRAGMDA